MRFGGMRGDGKHSNGETSESTKDYNGRHRGSSSTDERGVTTHRDASGRVEGYSAGRQTTAGNYTERD